MIPLRHVSFLLGALIAIFASTHAFARDANEILWDKWGVPHIYAENQEKAYYAMGWAQMRAHPNLMARIYGQAKGKAAEHWGEKYLQGDTLVHSMRISERADEWWNRQGRDYQRYLSAYAKGASDYARRHSDAIAPENRWVFPLVGHDVVAQTLRSSFLQFFLESWTLDSYLKKQSDPALTDRGSNSYALAPSRTKNGNAMLVINPHMPWLGDMIFFESHVVTKGVDAYGVSMVGSPTLSIAFTESHGWTHTVNNIDAMDVYELSLAGDGYILDGKKRDFVRSADEVIKVRDTNGKVHSRSVPILESVHGNVVYINEKTQRALALRYVGLDRPHVFEQYWNMLKADTLPAFEQAVRGQNLPYFNTLYANRGGDIFYLSNGILPERQYGDYQFWRKLLPGSTSDLLWSGDAGYDALPKLANPPAGFLQNANDPSWSNTFPFVLKASDYPRQLPPPYMFFRSQRATRMMLETPKFDFDTLVSRVHSSRMEMADRVLPELLSLARLTGDPSLEEPVKVLDAWDRAGNVDSRGAVLFIKWVEAMEGITGQGQPSLRPDWFAIPWDQDKPLTTPRGLQDPQKAVAALQSAANEVRKTYGTLDVPYGDVYRIRRGEADAPSPVAHQSFGSFAAGLFNKDEDNRYSIVGGQTFVAVVEFGKTVRAEGVLAYGNSSEPSSPHYSDQVDLFSRNKFRTLLRQRSEIEKQTEERERF